MRAYTVNSWGIFAYETLMVESPKVPDRQLAAFPKAWHHYTLNRLIHAF